MKVEGKLVAPKGGKNKYWGVVVPLLEIHTQGESRDDAYRMAQDAIESLVDKRGFRVICVPGKGNRFILTSNDSGTFLAFILSRLRTASHLTARQVAARLKSSSPNAYARYEQGKAIPRMDTLEELLKAIDPSLELVLKKAG